MLSQKTPVQIYMSKKAAAIAFTAEWLTTHQPVHFTGIAGNAHKMAHPHRLFQQIVTDHPDYWLTEHYYTPETGKKAGVRAHPFPEWRDEVLPGALRLYRARIEGVSVDEIPEVKFAYKREQAASGARAIRSIIGFASIPTTVVKPKSTPKKRTVPVDAPPAKRQCTLSSFA